MYEVTQEVLDCETNSLYKSTSFWPCFTLLWTNWLLLYRSCPSKVSCVALLSPFPHCISYAPVLNSIYQNKSYQLSLSSNIEGVNYDVFTRVT
jgi:hypothetical protein